jgi:hypothetical protein
MVEAFAAAAAVVELAAVATLLEKALQSEGLVAADGVNRVLVLNDMVVLLSAVAQTAIGQSSFCQLSVARALTKELRKVAAGFTSKNSDLLSCVTMVRGVAGKPIVFSAIRGLLANVAEAEEDFVEVLVEILQACTGADSPARKKRRGWLAKRETPEAVFARLQKKVYQVGSTFSNHVQELMAQTPTLVVGGGQKSGRWLNPGAGQDLSEWITCFIAGRARKRRRATFTNEDSFSPAAR